MHFLLLYCCSADQAIGLSKIYRLTYESVEIVRALFDKTSASNTWRISARVLRNYIDFFGRKTEQLDMVAKDGKAIFTSFTEKIMDGKGCGQKLPYTKGKLIVDRDTQTATRDSCLNLQGGFREVRFRRGYAHRHQRTRFQSYRHACRHAKDDGPRKLLETIPTTSVRIRERWLALRIHLDDHRRLQRRKRASDTSASTRAISIEAIILEVSFETDEHCDCTVSVEDIFD